MKEKREREKEEEPELGRILGEKHTGAGKKQLRPRLSSDRVALDLPKPIEGLKHSAKSDSVVVYIIEESGENITAKRSRK
uniref:Uncharacterized protein n=1 Tax=Vitis vinifera TaxID=29760 RepID=A5B382_VITVI|nr:hypothetical protein VITISV_036744 [Vitis vinifera]